MRRPLLFLMAISLMSFASESVHAQGLIWSLPEDGSWVRFEGDYRQTDYRPENNLGDLNLQWRQHLEIRSVGSEQAEYNGETVPARWIEFETTTGTAEGEIKAGPGGHQIYKILVPDSAIIGQPRDSNQIANEYLPIIKGYHKIGDEPAREIESGVFQAYPTVALLRNFQDLEEIGPSSVKVPAGTFDAIGYDGSLVSEGETTRTTNKAQIYASKEVPFGLVKWTVQIDREQRGSTDTRDSFKPHSQIRLTMEAHEIGSGAQSKIVNQ